MKTIAIILAGATALTAMPAAAQRFGNGEGLQQFEQADSNGDGLITRGEFVAARNARFDKMDRNGDGVVDKSDFKRLARFRPEAVDRLEAVIRQADGNNDGRLTRAELAAAPTPLHDRADRNGDGRVDQAELAALRATASAAKSR